MTSEPDVARCGFAPDDDFCRDDFQEDLDRRWMRSAVVIGRRGLGMTAPNPAVGAVLIKDGRVVGRGWTQPGGRPHAETEALRRAGERARGATLYVTLEPCSHYGKTPPCADAVIAAGVARVVIGVGDPDPRVQGRGVARLRKSGVSVDTGVLEEDCARLTAGHISRVTLGRPHVTLKLAVSSDGKAGLSGRRPVAITGEKSRRRVHLMRAEADAIMVGVGTILADDPSLTARLPGLLGCSPIRIVLDSDLKTPSEAAVIRSVAAAPTWFVAASDALSDREAVFAEAGVEIVRVSRSKTGLDLKEVLALLGAREVTRLMVEGGPTLAAALLDSDLIDEFFLLRGPEALGPEAIDALEGKSLETLTNSSRFSEASLEQVDGDLWTRYERVPRT